MLYISGQQPDARTEPPPSPFMLHGGEPIGDLVLEDEQGLLAVEPPAIAAKLTILAYDTVTRNSNGDLIRCTRLGNGPRGFGISNPFRELRICRRRSCRNATKRFPDLALERCTLNVPWQV